MPPRPTKAAKWLEPNAVSAKQHRWRLDCIVCCRQRWTKGIITRSAVVFAVHCAAVSYDSVIQSDSPAIRRRSTNLHCHAKQWSGSAGRPTRKLHGQCTFLVTSQRPATQPALVLLVPVQHWKEIRSSRSWDHLISVVSYEKPSCHSRPDIDIWPACGQSV